jgi:pterin-4a-carbinolamine dehydratase
MVTMEEDPAGTAKVEIKEESSAMTLRPHTKVEVTMKAETSRPKVAVTVIARIDHLDHHHHHHPQVEVEVEAVEVAPMETAEASRVATAMTEIME